MSGKSGESVKVKLPKPRLALIWFLPADSIFADLEAQVTPESADEAAVVQAFRDAMAADPEAESTAEDAEDAADAAFAESLGYNLEKAISLLDEAADLYERDPDAMEPLIQRITEGNEVGAQWVRDFLRSVRPKNDNGSHDEDGDDDDREATILDFERPDDHPDDNGDDDEGDES